MAVETYSGLGALTAIVGRTGKSRLTLSKEMGRFPSYLNSTINRGSVPTANVFSLIARACGYTLALIPDGTEIPDGSIVIEPSE